MIMPWDKNGNWVDDGKIKKNKITQINNKNFILRVENFLKKHRIKGIATTYGFSTTMKEDTIKKLDKLGIKYLVDYSNIWNTKILLSKKSI